MNIKNHSSEEEQQDIEILAKGTSSAFGGRIIGSGAIFLFQIILLRLLTPEAAGQFLWYLSIILLVASFSKFGIEAAVVKLVAVYSQKNEWGAVRATIRKAVAIVGCGGMLFVFIGIFATNVFSTIQSKSFLVLLVCVPFIGIMWIISETLRALKDVRKSVFIQYIWVGVAGIIFLFLTTAVGGKNTLMASSGMLVTYISATIIGFILLLKTQKKAIGFDGHIATREIFGVSLPMFLVGIGNQWMVSNEVLILGKFSQTEYVAYYSASLKTAALVSIVLMAVNSILAPMMAAAHYNNEKKRLSSMVIRAADWSLLAATPLVIILVMQNDFILNLFGPEYVKASYVLLILAVGQWINSAFGPGGNLFGTTVYQRHLAIIILSAAMLSMVLGYFLIKKWDIIGASFVATITILFWNLSIAITAWRKEQIRVISKRWRFPFFALVVAVSLSLFFHEHQIVELFLTIGLLASYFSFIWLFVLEAEEVFSIKRFLKKKKIFHVFFKNSISLN